MQNVAMTISELEIGDCDELSSLILSDPLDYRRNFTPFSFQIDDLKERINNSQKDRYWGIRYGKELIGFFMLRGFDEGYERPSYGVYISKRFANHGLSKLALRFALSWCRLNQVPSIMLKVHPDNIYARHTYEKAGFKFLEVCPMIGHDIFEKELEIS